MGWGGWGVCEEFLLLTHSSRCVYTPPKLSNSLNQRHSDAKTPGVRFHIGCTAHCETLFTKSGGGVLTSYQQDTITHRKFQQGRIWCSKQMTMNGKVRQNTSQKVYSSTQTGCWVSRRVQLNQRAVAQNEKSLRPIPGLQVPTISSTLRCLATTSRLETLIIWNVK